MSIYREVIETIFGFSLFVNAISFIPQIIRIVKEKSAKGVSLVTFSIFLGSQFAAVLYGLIIQSNILVVGYVLSMLTCLPVVLLVIFYRRNKHKLSEMETNIDGISFKDIVDRIPAHVYWKDLDGKCLGASNLQCENIGYARSSILGKNDFDFFPREQAEKIIAVDHEVLSTGMPIVCEEISSETNDRERCYLSHKIALSDKHHKVIGLLGVSIDITDARKKEIERGAFLENIIALMPGHVYWKDKNGHYLGCNDNQAKMLGLASRKEIVGLSVFDIYAKNSIYKEQVGYTKQIDSSDAEVMLKGETKTLEEPLVLTNGSQLVFLSQKVPLRDVAGSVIGLLGISIDITEKKKAEQELIRAKEAAEAADRAKTEFLANMSHDVKTPLSGVVGMADLMAHDPQQQVPQRAQAIYSCGMQLLAFFNSCLELSQLEMLEWASHDEVFSPTKMLHEIDAMFAPAAQVKKLELTVKADPALPAAVLGHRASIYRIMLNLIGNALKFTPQGSIAVRGYLSDTLSPDEVRVCLEVKDTGIGIPEDKREAIFEKMCRLTPAYEGKIEGSGIGLYIVDQYVKRMGGKIQVDSTLGEGSTFSIFLPMKIMPEEMLDDNFHCKAIEKPQPVVAAADVAAPMIEEKKVLVENAPRILLVEDNPLIQHVTQSLLNGSGFSVDIAGTGAEALEKFAANQYDLVYMDIGLPDQDGYSVTQALRQHEQTLGVASPVPVIALTAHGAMDVETFCTRAGMQGVISKPLTREHADAIWNKFGLGKTKDVSGLTVIPQVEVVPLGRQIVDMDGTIALLGSREYAEELLALWYEMLTHRFLPALNDFITKQDYEPLRHELHTMLGSLCYVKTPLLNQAVVELQTAARSHPHNIAPAYEHVLSEAQRFIAYYQQNFV